MNHRADATVHDSRRMTFRQYLDAKIVDRAEADPEVDVDDLAEEFTSAINGYGFGLDDEIPGTFEVTLAKHIL